MRLESGFGIEDDQDDVRAFDELACLFTCQMIEGIGRHCAYAGRVDESHTMPSQEDLLRYGVAGSPRDIGDNDPRVLEQGVHQGGLADVGGTRDHDRDATLQPRCCLCVREQFLDLCVRLCCKTCGCAQGTRLVLCRK